MATTIEFELIAPEKVITSEQVEMVVVPATEGDIGVLPGHSSLIANVRPGVIEIRDEGMVKERIFVAGGFCEISPKLCTVLAGEAIFVKDIDKDVAQRRQLDAQEAELNADEKNKLKAHARRLIADAMMAAMSN